MDYENYEGQFISNKARREEMSIGARYADYRTKVPGGRKKQEFISESHYDWARDIIRIRGEQLAETHRGELVQIFDGNYRTIDLIAHKYLRDDYRISPRTARRAVYHALEVLIAKKILNPDELAFIDPDPLNVRKPLYSKPKGYKRIKRVGKNKRTRREREVERELALV